MQRQSIIYAVFAALGFSVATYAIALCMSAWSRFGWSATFALLAFTAMVLSLPSVLFAYLAFLFRSRAVSAVSPAADGVLLMPEGKSFPGPVLVSSTRVVRVFGEQFSRNEAAPAYALFAAAGKLWVASAQLVAPRKKERAQ